MLSQSRLRPYLGILILTAFPGAGFSASIPVGTVNFDLTGLPGTATVDIANQTGPNSSAPPDMTFPVTTSVPLTNLGLTLNFTGGFSESFGASYFTLAPDGLSFDGATLSITAPVTSAVVGGNFGVTAWSLNDGSSVTASSSFTATITDPSGTLASGDFAVLYGTTGATVTPEPSTWLLVGATIAAFGLLRLAGQLVNRFSISRTPLVIGCLSLLCASPFLSAATTQVKLNSWVSPSMGVSGTTPVWVTGSGFPSGTVSLSSVGIALQTSCGVTTGETSATAAKVVPIIGTSEKFEFTIPSSLASGNYFVSLSGKTTTGASFSSSNCSEVKVTHSSTAFSSCNPGSSMAMLVPGASSGTTPVTAYVPNGYWAGGASGVRVVHVEGAGSPSSISTTNVVNSCSADSSLGSVICTANNSDVYVIKGASLSKTLTSASNAFAGFSGGSCMNCGVAVNAITHQAVITMGYSGVAGALQFLDLNTLTLGTPIPTTYEVSEDVLWDPFRNLVLSPDEQQIYDLFEISGNGLPAAANIAEFSNSSPTGAGTFDSAGEDCSTGIALSSEEGPGGVYIVDLTQKTQSSGTWTAPGQRTGLPELYFSAATDGIAVAPGTTHLGIVAGEFGGSGFGAIQLPSKAGSGTPDLVDYVAATLPNTPDGNAFTTGYDPHTTTAYTSPNNNKAYGVMADWATNAPAYLAIIDLEALLKAPRTGAHTIDPTYDLLANGVVRYVVTH